MAIAAFASLAISGCGGSHAAATSNQSPTTQPSSGSPTIASVAVTCAPTTVNAGGTAQCTATVQGTGNYSSAVNWTASDGAITAAGLFTAPATAGSVTITAASVQDGSKTGGATLTVQYVTPASHHVVLVMEENQSYSTVVGSSAWPNLNNLIANGALPTQYYANTHPSIGNYLMLTTGQVLTNDDNSTMVWNVDNIARQMLAANVSFRVYAEGITQGYVGGNTGLYLIRHNPFALLSDVAGNTAVADQVIWPFSQFAADLAAGTLPEFSFIVPDVEDDAHNGTPQQADTWLQSNVVIPLANQAAFQSGGDGLLIVDFDEAATSDTSYGGGHVSPVLWGPVVKSGYQQTSSTDLSTPKHAAHHHGRARPDESSRGGGHRALDVGVLCASSKECGGAANPSRVRAPGCARTYPRGQTQPALFAATRPTPRKMAFIGQRPSASGKKISPSRRASGR